MIFMNSSSSPASLSTTVRIPSEIIKHIFSYSNVMVHVVDRETIRMIGALRELGSEFVEAIADTVKELNVGSLLQNYKERDRRYVVHLSENIGKIVNIFPKVERLNLDGLLYMKNDQLAFLLKSLKLKEISTATCYAITRFDCNDITQFETITLSSTMSIRLDVYNKIGLSVYNGKPKTIVKVQEGMNIFLKTLTNNIIELELYRRDGIHDVKLLYEAFTGIQADHQRMIFAGKRLCDDNCLDDYGCSKAGATLHVVFRLSSNSKDKVYARPNYDLVKFTPQEELKSSTIYEHDEFKVLELDLFNQDTCEIFSKDILFEKQDDHDYNITNHLSAAFKNYLNSTVIPYLNNLRSFQRKIHQVENIFVVHYSLQEDQDFVLHIDSSYVTLNICVFTSSDFAGNEIEFVTNNEQEVSEQVSECGCGEQVDGTHLTYRRVVPSKGKAFVHLGNHPHKTLNITSGNRFNVVCWLK